MGSAGGWLAPLFGFLASQAAGSGWPSHKTGQALDWPGWAGGAHCTQLHASPAGYTPEQETPSGFGLFLRHC